MTTHYLGLIFALFLGFSTQATPSGDAAYSIDPKSFNLPAFPSMNSQEHFSDFQRLHFYQENRTERDCDIAKIFSKEGLKPFFGDLLYDGEKESLKLISKKLVNTAENVSDFFKDSFLRQRPYVLDRSLKPCAGIDLPKSPNRSYPSAHTTKAHLLSKMLTQIFPERAFHFRSRAKQISEYRVIAGLHHPSDLVAGEQLALQIFNTLLQDKDFQKDLKAAEVNAKSVLWIRPTRADPANPRGFSDW